jgi:hypothetical protein
MPTPDEQRVLDELAQLLLEELLRRGEPEGSARAQVAAAFEMWRRRLTKPH